MILRKLSVAIFLVCTLFYTQKNASGQCSANAAFAYSFQVCSTVEFVDQSSAAANYTISWEWDFGDGNTSNLQNPVHTFAPGSSYLVSLTITADSSGVTCTDQATASVAVPPQPNVFFTWDPEPTCLSEPTSFYGSAGTMVVSWNWDFGDGQSSNLRNPVHLYTVAGTYDVALSVLDVNGCTDTIIQQVTVIQTPDVSISVDPDPSCLNEPTNFSGNSASSITSWEWDFGDGGSAFGQTVMHTYLIPGTYNVSLTVTDIDGCQNTEITQVSVNPLPSPVFSHSGPSCAGDSVEFYDASTTPNGYIVRWDWDFGDGNSTTVNYPDNPNVSHLYATTGTFLVTLTVTDSDSCTNSTLRQVIVEPNPVAGFTFTNACDGEPVYFTDLSSPNGGSDIISWYWEFDDPSTGINNTSNLQNPTHLFSASGTYDVLLLITNGNGCMDSITHPVTVNELPYVEISTDSDSTCVNQPTNFYGSGSNIISWLWDFGDGGTSVKQNPVYVYSTPGNYVVTLTATDDNGCVNDTSIIMYVNAAPNTNFTHSSPSCSGYGIEFYDLSTTPQGYIVLWHWYFGDGSDTTILFPDDPDVAHTYSDPGAYMVSLVTMNSTGCIDSTSSELTVAQGPQALFTTSGPPCEDNLVQFLDQSLGFGYTIQSWFWNFDDPSSGSNNTSTLQNPVHQFNYAGTYNVFLEVTSSNGCIDSITIPTEIHPHPDLYFNSSPAVKCEHDTVYFSVDPDSTDLGAVVSYNWDFGDPSSGTLNNSTLQNPWHIFTGSGSYLVTLTITDSIGCQNSYSDEVFINPSPEADFLFQNNCANDSTAFFDQSAMASAPITGWNWDFDDPASPNNTSTVQNPYHDFTAPDSYFVRLAITDDLGCRDTVRKWVTIFDNPNAYYTFHQACDPEGTVHFSDSSFSGASGSPLQSYYWEIDEGYYSTEVNPVYTYGDTDTCYHVALTITDKNLCTDTYTDTVCVFENITVDFTGSTVCFGHRTIFNTSYTPASDSVISWEWDFGDGTPILNTPFDTASHQYAAPGNYLVELTGRDIYNCTSILTKQITVDPLPAPAFTYDTANCNDVTHFYDQSSGVSSLINSWYWDFGDTASGANNFSTEQNPTHLYDPIDSIYYVTLIVTDVNGCSDSLIEPVIKGPCITPGFTVSDDPHCTDDPVCFTDTSQFYGSSGNFDQWTWNFGDGTSETYTMPQDSICHIYDDPGTYLVQLIISADVQGTVFMDTAETFILVQMAPTAHFSFTGPCMNQTTWFENETEGNGTTIDSWVWDFGNPASTNDTSSAKHPGYAYPSTGTFYPELTASNTLGCKNTFSDTIRIVKPPRADFEYSNTCQGDPSEFTDVSDTSASQISTWEWSFGDPLTSGDSSVLQNPTYVYDTTGIYTVTLAIEDETGCYDTISRDIEVYVVPEAAFTVIEPYKSIQGKAYMENQSEGANVYYWDFDNGTTSQKTNPVVTFEEDGTYQIQLIAVNQYNCADTMILDHQILFKGLYVPNAFIPGSDEPGLNTFIPIGTNLKLYEIEIYSMWGNLLWQSSSLDENGSPKEGWDGTYKDELMPAATYIWKIRATFRDNTVWPGMGDGEGNFSKSGIISLIR